MERYAAQYPPGDEYEISTLLWGALVFLALFASCFLAWRAIEWLRNRTTSDGGAVGEGRTEDPEQPWDQAISRPSGDYFYYGDECGGLGGMNKREQEEIFSTYAPRKVRKAMRERRRAREQAQKQSKGTS
jgi:hypothetical protein